MKKFIYLFTVFISFSLHAQVIDTNKQLPQNKTIVKGVLSNGLTYYIYPTDVTKDAASYYIIQNVGSVLENDDQQGLAHFLEHMAFNGTENFAGKGVLNTLRKEGAVFGQDINAYTSFDETVYNMNNIPTKPELIDTCLLILKDWSDGLLLTDEEIDAERGVIKEEWRTRQSGGMRIFQQSLPVMFNNTIYAQRMPIGLMDIVANFDYKTLRDFYHDWYRTDLQAIAIIGDVDAEEIEQKIKALFSDIPAIENPKERFTVNIPDNEKLIYALVQDKEVTTAQLEFAIRHPKPATYKTEGDLQRSLIESMITSMFSARIGEIAQNPDTPFLGTRISYGKTSRATDAFAASISPKPGKQQEAFKVVMEEIYRAVKFGFTQEEMDRTISQFRNYYETQISKEDDKSHYAIVYDIQENYLEHKDMVDVEAQFPIIEAILANLTTGAIHERLRELYTEKNRSLIVTGVETTNNLTEQQALSILNSVENDASLTAYSDAFSGKTLISSLDIKSGKIVSEKQNRALKSTTFKLSNDITVHYKHSDKNKNDVQLEAVSYGGLSLIEDANLPSAKYATTVVQQSGLGDYSITDLNKVTAGKTAQTYIEISELTESIYGSSVTKDVETMLQMVHLRFVQPRFDKDAYDVFKGQVDNYIIQRSENVNEKILDSVTVNLYGFNNPKKRIFNTEFGNEIKFETIKKIYLERFENASDFEFFIVGDLDIETLKPLLETYIASIPTKNKPELWKDNSSEWLKTNIDKDVFIKMEDPKSTVRISYKNNFKYNLKNNLLARTLADVLDLRYMERLREEEGGTYGTSVYGNVTKRPTETANLWIQFDSNPDKVDNLLTIVHSELKSIAEGTISIDDLEKTKSNYLKEYKQQQDDSRYDMARLKTFFREGYDMNKPENFDTIVKGITKESLANFTKAFLKNKQSYEIVIKPMD